MPKFRILLILTTLLASQAILAGDEGMAFASKPCAMVAEACSKAGFSRDGAEGKRFWMECMKPVVLGQHVKNITIEPAAAKACRMNKIAELKQELAEFEGAR